MGRIKHIVITYLAKRLLKVITEEDILQRTSREWLLNKRKLETDEVALLKEEAVALKESAVWQHMTTELKWLANKKMFDHARTNDDIVFGKAMLYNQDMMEKFLDSLIQN